MVVYAHSAYARHVSRSSALGGWDGELITQMYIDTSPASMVTIDDFLSPIALSEMFQYLTKSTIFLIQKVTFELVDT